MAIPYLTSIFLRFLALNLFQRQVCYVLTSVKRIIGYWHIMRSFKLITMGTLWMWTRIFGIDSKIMIIFKPAKHSVKGKLVLNYVEHWIIWTIDFQSSENNPVVQLSDPIFRWDETAFDPNYENLPLSEFRPMLKKILQRYIMVIHIHAETTLKWQNLLSSNDIFLSIF